MLPPLTTALSKRDQGHSRGSTYLFLDFDGVLHPADAAIRNRFLHADRLGVLLVSYPEVMVVVSSSWGKSASLEELRLFCGPVLGPRLHGVTPIVKSVLGGPPAFHRFLEIAYWLARHAARAGQGSDPVQAATVRSDWIALDDSDFWFPPSCRQLIHVGGGRGLADIHLAELESRLVDLGRAAR